MFNSVCDLWFLSENCLFFCFFSVIIRHSCENQNVSITNKFWFQNSTSNFTKSMKIISFLYLYNPLLFDLTCFSQVERKLNHHCIITLAYLWLKIIETSQIYLQKCFSSMNICLSVFLWHYVQVRHQTFLFLSHFRSSCNEIREQAS